MPSANPMRDQILATPSALLAAFDEMERAARLVLTTPEIYATRRLLLTGSGDSYFAAKAAELALMAHTCLPLAVRPPMEAGRYASQLAQPDELRTTLAIALSNSGGAARVAEAATLLRAGGAMTLAVTKAAGGRLAGLTHKALVLPIPDLPPAPGYGPYLFAVTALLLLGIRIGEVRMGMTMDMAQGLRADLKQALKGLDAAQKELDAAIAPIAALIADRPLVEFVGAGPDYAVAEYGAAKLLEAAGLHAYARELEEWTHLNYFDAKPGEITTVLAIAPSSRAQGRAVELVRYMHRLGRALLVIGGGPAASEAAGLGHRVIETGTGIAELWSPLLLSAAPALLAAHAAAAAGAVYGRGSVGPWADSADASTVQRSEIWGPTP